jgi:hypothetical protein
MTEKNEHALYLVKDGEHPKLFHKDDIAGAKADGWKQPDFPKSNGADWNHEDDLLAQDAAAEFAKTKQAADEKTAAEKAKADEKAQAEAKKSEPGPQPDLKVQVVEPKKPAKK